ncbi:histidine kinase [Streptomyces umbrinus]|uniref:histidine kinase n=1 Tax=Streptomyces umbrinus TaxID=67370 RepID=UPI003C2F4C0A
MRSGGEVAGDRAVRTAAVAALLLLLMLAVWASVLAAADHAWLRAHYDAPRIITVANCFAMGAPVTVLGVLLVTRSAGRRLGGVLVAAAMGCFLPTIVWDLFAAGDMSPADTVLCVTVAGLGLACRAPMVLLLPLWLVPARTRPVRWARSGLTLVVAGYFLGYGLLWALALPRLGSVSNPLWHTPLGHWAAIPFYDRYAVVEEYVVQAMTAVGTTALALVAVRTPDSGRRLLLLLAALYPLCAHLLLSDFWGPGLRTVAALLTGSVLWLAVIGVSIAGTDVWRLDRATRHRIAQACVAMVLAVAVTGTFAVTWAADPAVGDGETLAAAACSLALGWILRPAAHRATTWVERAFYGPRARPHDAARALAARLQQAPYPHEVPEQICRSAVEDVGVSGAAVSVDTRAGPRLLASAGTPPTSPAQTFPLRYHGQTVGRLDITSDGSAAPPERERALLALLADQAGPALAALRLTEEAQAARERLVLTREEERRRLRREIHDGLGPLLASVRLRIDNCECHPFPSK